MHLGVDIAKFLLLCHYIIIIFNLYMNSLFFLQSLAPKYEELAKIFAGESGVLIGKVDATEEESLAKT